jgi:hypothetical protein
MESLNGMTINERLFALSKLEKFEDAVKSNNVKLAIQILEESQLSHSAALETVSILFKNPKLYGF